MDDSAGKTVQRQEVVLKSGTPHRPALAAWVFAAGIPAPVAAVVAVPLTAGESESDRYESSRLLAMWKRGFPAAWPALLAVLAVAVVMAWLCYRRQKRYAQPWTAAWVILVLLGGVPGLAGYLLHRRWPVLEKCPACGSVVPRDRERCAIAGRNSPSRRPRAPRSLQLERPPSPGSLLALADLPPPA